MWAARDKDGTLYLFNKKPIKNDNGYWGVDPDTDEGDGFMFITDSPLYLPKIKWEDDEPTEVEITIKHK